MHMIGDDQEGRVIVPAEAPFYEEGLGYIIDHSVPGRDTSTWKEIFHGSIPYALGNVIMYGPLASDDPEEGHRFCQQNGIDLVGLYSSKIPRTAKGYAIAHLVFRCWLPNITKAMTACTSF